MDRHPYTSSTAIPDRVGIARPARSLHPRPASRIHIDAERVAWRDPHAKAGDMSKSKSSSGTIDVDGLTYDWRLEREPQCSDDAGWKGMIISLLQHDAQREALLEFPPPKRLLKGLPRGRLQLDDATICRGVRSALMAGWEPISRGKPMVFTVDAEGH